ncbi:cyclic GMP-AMP synthase-like receptor 1 [Oculina patagonica]
MALSECIMYLDENFAKLPDDKETQDIQKAIEEAVSSLLKIVATSDHRFESKLTLSGSFYEGTKIRQADEFDFMACLSRLSDICDIVYLNKRNKRHVLMQVLSHDEAEVLHFWKEFCEEVNTEPFSRTCSNQGTFPCLDGSKLKQKFYSLLREAFKTIAWPLNLKFLTSTGRAFDQMGLSGATQAAASEKLDFLWKDRLKVSVDLTLAIECKRWPSLSGIFDSLIDENHPAFSVKNEIKSSGFHVVPKLGAIWRISWSRAEAALLKYIFSQNEQAAVSYRVAKLINETHFVEVREDYPDIHVPMTICESFSLKHLLMFLVISNPSYLTRSCSEILVDLLQLLLDGLNTANCPLVFLSDSSSLKAGPLLQCHAVALKQCINVLLSMQETENCQVPRTCEDFFKEEIPVVLPRPPRNIRSYKITKL